MKSKELILSIFLRILTILSIFTLICTGIYFLGYHFEEKTDKISVIKIFQSPVRFIKSILCSYKHSKIVGPYLKGIVYLARKYNPFDKGITEIIEEEELIYEREQVNETVIVKEEFDPVQIQKLRDLIQKIQESEENINETLNLLESEVAKLKEIVNEINPKATKEEIRLILEKLTKFNKDADRLIDEIVKRIAEEPKRIWREHEVAVYYLGVSSLSQYSGIFNKTIKFDDREVTLFEFKLDHPTYVKKIQFDNILGNNDPGLVTEVDIKFLSYNREMMTRTIKTKDTLVLGEPILIDKIDIIVKEYNDAEGTTTELTTFHVLETAIGAK